MSKPANVPAMDPTIAATIIGVLMSVAFGAFATAFAWLRSDMNTRFDKVDSRFEKLEALVIGLIAERGRGRQPNDLGESDADH